MTANDIPTKQDILAVVAALDLLHADAVIEDAVIEDALNPQPLLPPEALDGIHAAKDSGDPVRAAAADILVDLYRTGALGVNSHG